MRLVHSSARHLPTRAEMETLFDMVTTIPTRRLGIPYPGIVPGALADLVILGKPDLVEALRYHQPPQWVINRGKLVDTARMEEMSL